MTKSIYQTKMEESGLLMKTKLTHEDYMNELLAFQKMISDMVLTMERSIELMKSSSNWKEWREASRLRKIPNSGKELQHSAKYTKRSQLA